MTHAIRGQGVDRIERIVDVEAARPSGLTAVDPPDGWAPIIFADGVGPVARPCRAATARCSSAGPAIARTAMASRLGRGEKISS